MFDFLDFNLLDILDVILVALLLYYAYRLALHTVSHLVERPGEDGNNVLALLKEPLFEETLSKTLSGLSSSTNWANGQPHHKEGHHTDRHNKR